MKTLLLLLIPALAIAVPAARADTQIVPLAPGVNYIGAHVVEGSAPGPARACYQVRTAQ